MNAEDSDANGPAEQQWRLFEREVARVLAELDPSARVQHDARIRGRLSETTRQIDALITSDIVGHAVTLVAECKRYTRPVGIGLVDEFIGKLLDVGASAGIMYAFDGYTSDAKARATGARNPAIELRQLLRCRAPSRCRSDRWDLAPSSRRRGSTRNLESGGNSRRAALHGTGVHDAEHP